MRPLCENCGQRLAKRGRELCDGCYDIGVHLAKQRVQRPPAKTLVDTGLRIDNRFNELVHLDGTRVYPVPGELILTHFIGKPTHDGLLPVLRAGARVTKESTCQAK